jgi:hypothetical protein
MVEVRDFPAKGFGGSGPFPVAARVSRPARHDIPRCRYRGRIFLAPLLLQAFIPSSVRIGVAPRDGTATIQAFVSIRPAEHWKPRRMRRVAVVTAAAVSDGVLQNCST